MKKFRVLSVLVLALAVILCMNSALACTIFSVGKDATTDGSTITTHNDDSTGADFRLWIIPSMEGGEGVKRDLVVDSHAYGDYSDYPNTKDYGNGYAINEIDQPEDTNAYFHSRYSFMNDKGVAMGESTFWCDESEYGQKVNELIYGSNTGIIDCWNAQDIALERANTAREAVEIMGNLIETYGWGTVNGGGETINIVDGNEVWIFEAYGDKLWAAVRIPDDGFFVSANRARICDFDFEDTENYLCWSGMKDYAVENGLWTEGEFSPAKLFAPNEDMYSTLREWRALDLVAPSLGLSSEDTRFPLYVIPENKLSVKDVFDLAGDYYQGTEFDVSRTAYGGDNGNPLNFNAVYRTINMYRTCYLMLANVRADLPDEIKCLAWYGYGAPHSTFITPLWPTMTEMPAWYDHGSRYEAYDPTCGWWVNTFVQDTAARNYDLCIKKIQEVRDDRMVAQIEEVHALQDEWAAMINDGKKDEAIAAMTKYACDSANAWFEDWNTLSNELVSAVVWNRVNEDHSIHGGSYSEWWEGVLDVKNAGLKPIAE